ncbi:aminotransferase class I/II-fold pyridoxal phosphate-dependent enzyme [Pimelobacter simplex]|uniref:8-amino-7-oxononanoate synthase n=1 Tax=Nocardioides simplex TaxID=2045 RepID=A0A0A1DNR4_NOCSI|nr:8-amino-7-oxononanoate synthase [Pimelobacter simplex]AIY18292.1 8-amino-7-oxononanoate synthase [Pimelobacter simplex]MCG8153402.1 aminotransferase class I/II-fold pyridoxal phosphate-dependent enzyme [Pimelobacter simplex]GEB15926.1 8-amino-7-oxononanoate synthase [Pimelobacter simplex]SFN12858.1 8-amino-7-oxononanoate synthase [Pimelobacter simplex]
MSAWETWLAEQAATREAAGLTRRLRPRAADDPAVDLAGNDYLGLARDPGVRRAAADAALAWGAGASASRLVTGTLGIHDELERELADYLGQPAALVLSTGYHANLAVVTALADRGTRVLSDAHIHASLVDAVRLSRARLTVVPHSDVDAVRAGLVAAAADGERTIVLAESVYSVLGDAAPLVELAELCAEHDALLVVDEAHGLGVHGPGLVATLGLAGLPHVVVTATLSKSLGAQGGAVLGSPALREHLVNRARPFIFDTGLAPAPTAGALAALRALRARPELGTTVRARVAELADVLGVAAPAGAVLSVPMSSPQAAVAAQAAALGAGLRVGCFRPPSVPDGISRLRITASAGVPDDDWARAVATLAALVKEHQ